jgi:hypothetical protein
MMIMKEIHDYDLYDEDFREWWRRGLEAFGMDPSIADAEEEEAA